MQSDESEIHEGILEDWKEYFGVDVKLVSLLMMRLVYDMQACAWRLVVGDNCNLIALGARQWVVMAPGIWIHE